jgi:hypothetical protein
MYCSTDRISDINGETERIYKNIIFIYRRKQWNEFSIYLNYNSDYHKIIKNIQRKFWFTKIYYCNMGVSIGNSRRIGICLQRKFRCKTS